MTDTIYVVKNLKTNQTHTVIEGHFSLESDDYEVIGQQQSAPGAKVITEEAQPEPKEVKEQPKATKAPAKPRTTKKRAPKTQAK